MEKPRIVLVERRRSAHKSFADALRKRYQVSSVISGKQALASAVEVRPVAIVVDAISMNSPGDRIVHALKAGQPAPVIHLVERSVSSDADVVLEAPVSSRKLTSTLDRLTTPVHSGPDALVVGPFEMDIERRVLRVHGKEKQLTPKLALLVEMFLRHPGETLDRRQLMERVWQTDYLGDTRTLDVHVRWIRSLIERDPAHPEFLKTVRGIGYRLEPGESSPVVSVPAKPRRASA